MLTILYVFQPHSTSGSGCDWSYSFSGEGESQVEVGAFANEYACAHQCSGRTATNDHINGATYKPSSGACVCEENMTSKVSENSENTCYLPGEISCFEKSRKIMIKIGKMND